MFNRATEYIRKHFRITDKFMKYFKKFFENLQNPNRERAD